MRNVGSKLHLPSREWKKVIRFNHCDYILRSIYDGLGNKRKPKYITAPKDLNVNDITDSDYDYINENFFGDMLKDRVVGNQKNGSANNQPDDDDDFDTIDFDIDDDWDFEAEEEPETDDSSSDDSEFDTDDDFVETPDKTNGRDDSVWGIDDSFSDNVYGDFDDIVTQMADDAVDAVFNSTTYNIKKQDGSEFPVRLSDNSYVNSIFYVIEPVAVVANSASEQTHKRIDDFMYISGRRNNKVAYKIDISGITEQDGSIRFIIGGQKAIGFIHVYYVDNKNIDFTIKCPGININGKKDCVILNYSQFCHLIDSNPLTMTKKGVVQYYKPMVNELMEYLRNKGVGVKLCKIHPLRTFRTIGNAQPNLATLKDNFDIIANYGEKEYGDINLMKSAVDESAELVDGVFNGGVDNSDFVDDENYVIIGGNEKYYNELMKSMWSHDFTDDKVIHINFKTPDPANRLRKIDHNMMLMPMARFMLVAGPMILHILDNH